MASNETWRRWRLVLGDTADNEHESQEADSVQNGGQGSKPSQQYPSNKPQAARADSQLSAEDRQRDKILEYLSQREYQDRLINYSQNGDNRSSTSSSTLTPAHWLAKARKVFPTSTVHVLQQQAIHRYGLNQLLSDPAVLKSSPANMSLVQTLLTFRHQLQPEVMSEVKRIIAEVCHQLEQAMAKKVLAHFSSRRLRHKHGGRRLLSNLDWSKSITNNLKNYNKEHEQIILERLYFYKRQREKLPWDIYLVVDQSGSMVESIIHAAVLASVFCRLPSISTHLILFDTQVVDLSEAAGDPVENLLAVQLGGGTDIGGAMVYTAEKIQQPQRSIVLLISDFYEGRDERVLLQQCASLIESQVKLIGLAALDEENQAQYDERLANELVAIGMPISAMTPDHLAQWISEIMS